MRTYDMIPYKAIRRIMMDEWRWLTSFFPVMEGYSKLLDWLII